MILVFILYFLLAITFILAKAVLAIFDPIFFIGLRMTLAGILLLSGIYYFKKSSWHLPEKKHWNLFAQIIIFHIFFAYVLEFWGLQSTSAAKVCFIYNLTPFITALLSYFLFKERLLYMQWIGLGIGFLGIIPLLDKEHCLIPAQLLCFSLTDVVLLGSVCSAAYGWIIMKKLVTQHYSPFMINGIGMLGGGLLAFLVSLVIEGQPHLKILMPMYSIDPLFYTIITGILYTVLLILLGNLITYNLYGYLLHYYSATFLSLMGLITPLFTAFLSYVFLGEQLTWHFAAALGITGIGLVIFYIPLNGFRSTN